MEKQSLLKKTNSWKPFLEESRSARKARDYRRETIQKILSIIDPSVSIWPGSFFAYILGQIIGPGFVLGRKLLFFKPFKQFLVNNKKLFENAPLQVISEWNYLMHYLFDETVAHHLLLEEKLAREKQDVVEKALAEGEKAKKTFKAWALKLKKFSDESSLQIPSDIFSSTKKEPEKAPSKAQSLFSPYTPLSTETQHSIFSIISREQLSFTPETQEEKKNQAIIQQVEKAAIEYKKAASDIRVSLSSPNISQFKDLLRTSTSLNKLSFSHSFLTSLFAEESLEESAKKLTLYISNALMPLQVIKEKAEGRARKLVNFHQEKERLLQRIAPFSKMDQLSSMAGLLTSQITAIDIPENIYNEKSSEEIDAIYAEAEKTLTKIEHSIFESFKTALFEQKILKETVDQYTTLILLSYFSLLTPKNPYPDLENSIGQLSKKFLLEMASLRTKAIEKTVSPSDYFSQMIQKTVAPDSRLIFGEMEARAFKLKDLSLAIEKESLLLSHLFFIQNLLKTIDPECILLRKSIKALLYKLQDPFPLFKEALDLEALTTLFRYWWEDFDRMKNASFKMQQKASWNLSEGEKNLKRPLMRTIDTIDGITKPKPYKKIFQTSHTFFFQSLEEDFQKLPQGLPYDFLFPLSTLPTGESEPLIEKFFQLEEKKKEILAFAENVKALGATQSEKISSILTIFSLLKVLPPEDLSTYELLQKQSQIIENSLFLVEEELCIELSNLDKSIRFEHGHTLEKILPKLLLLLPKKIEQMIASMKLMQTDKNPYRAALAYYFLKEYYVLQQSLASLGFEMNNVFAFVQKVSLHILYARLLQASIDPMNYSVVLLLPFTMQKLLATLEKQLGEKKQETLSQLSRLESLLITPIQIINIHLIEKDSVQHQLSEYVQSATELLSQYAEPDERANALLHEIDFVKTHLEEIISLKKIPLLTYIPGCLRFFLK